MTQLPRLSLASLADSSAPRPLVEPRSISMGIVHLGVGAFHRAHQAVFTEDAMAATGDTRWGIHGVTQRSPQVREDLAPQDGLYGVLTLGLDATGAEEASVRTVGVMRAVSFPREETADVLEALGAPATHVVTLTVTEKGYRRAADGGPDLDDADVAADVAQLAADLDSRAASDVAARTPIGMLARGLARRWRSGGAPITVVCCDNLTHNGRQLERLVAGVVSASGAPAAAELGAWLDESVRFPATMVDRIVPRTDERHRARAESLTALRDHALVVAEPFKQWVIEDDFAAPRPAWEEVGATLTSDVAPFENAKLRILNATHSTLAYAGASRGYATIADAVGDPGLLDLARTLVDVDVLPTLRAPEGLDLAAYRDEVLERFANPALGHTTVQVAMDGSQKLPIRLLGTVRDRVAAGEVPQAAARVVAEWAHYVRASSQGELVIEGRPVALSDPMTEQLRATVARGGFEALLDLEEIFGDLSGHQPWRDAVMAAADELEGTR